MIMIKVLFLIEKVVLLQGGEFRSHPILATLKFNKLCIDDVCVGIVDALTPDVLTTRRGSLEGLHLYKGNASGNHVYLGF